MTDVNLVHTSTPILKSSKGRMILKELFVNNLPSDITLIKQEESNKIQPNESSQKDAKILSKIESPVVHKDVKKFLEANKKENSSINFTPPKSLTPSTKRLLEEFYQKSTDKKLKIDERRFIRL